MLILLDTTVSFTAVGFGYLYRARRCYSSFFQSEFVELYNINNSYRNAMIYMYSYLAFVFFTPISALFFFNIMIILEVRKIENRSRKVHAEMKPDNSVKYQSMAKEISISTMLIAVVCGFLICNTLFFVTYVLGFILPPDTVLWTVPWQHVLVMANQLINACIFYLFIDHYRRTVAKLLWPCRYVSKYSVGPTSVTEETNLQSYEISKKNQTNANQSF
uniref:G-protein coupled receptors family 1 profile domain-containing protein n=1 Tax=Meloidogyne javanica TaxID=6303 RepID=A0A915LTA2_MELJA